MRDAITCSPRVMSSRQSSGGGLRCSSVSRLPAIDLIGPSELPSSWPMTRISRCHACRSCSRSGRLTSDSTSRSCGSPPSRNVVRRTSQRPTLPPGSDRSTTRGASPNQSVTPSSSAVRPSICSMLRPISRSPVRLTMRSRSVGIEREHRDVDLLHHRAQQRRGFDGAEPLLVQRLGELVDLDQHGAERILRIGRAAANREVVFAHRGEQIGERLQRQHDAAAQRRREPEQEADDDDRERPLHLGRVVAGPEDDERGQRAGQARRRWRAETPAGRGSVAARCAGASGALTVPDVLELVALQAAIERAARQAERARGLADVAVARHRLLDQERFDVFEAHVLEARAAGAFGAQAEVARADGVALRHQHGAFDRVIELADVARPAVIEQHLHRRRIEAGQRLAIALRVQPQEVPRQQRDVFAPIAQRRQVHFDRVQAEEQVLPESAGLRLPRSRSALVAEISRTLTLRVFDDPSRSNSPVSMTRSSFCCWLSGTLAISSRNSVLPSASSKRPTRSTLASVNAPFMWPNSSDSNTPSAMPPALTVTIGRFARGDTACSACATRPLPVPFSPVISTLASDGPDARDDVEHRPHRRRFGQQRRMAVGHQRLVGGLELPAAPNRPAQLGLRPDDRQQPLVVPRLLDEVARAAAHRFDRDVHRAPRGHHDDRQRFVGGVNALQQVEAFFARRRVARVVEIHQDDVVVLQLHRAQQLLRRRRRVDQIAFGLQQQPQRFEHVGLIVADQNARRRLAARRAGFVRCFSEHRVHDGATS